MAQQIDFNIAYGRKSPIAALSEGIDQGLEISDRRNAYQLQLQQLRQKQQEQNMEELLKVARFVHDTDKSLRGAAYETYLLPVAKKAGIEVPGKWNESQNPVWDGIGKALTTFEKDKDREKLMMTLNLARTELAKSGSKEDLSFLNSIEIPQQKEESAGYKEIDPYMRREIAKAKTSLAEARPLVLSAINEIDRVRKLNQNSYGGKVGEAIVKAKSALNIGSNDTRFKNTVDTVNSMKGQVARVLKSTFGGQLSDGEREYLNSIYGALSDMSKTEREIAMKNVKNMLFYKLKGEQSKVDELIGDVGYTSNPSWDQSKESRYQELLKKRGGQ